MVEENQDVQDVEVVPFEDVKGLVSEVVSDFASVGIQVASLVIVSHAVAYECKPLNDGRVQYLISERRVVE